MKMVDWYKSSFNAVELYSFYGEDVLLIGLNTLCEKVGKDKNLKAYVNQALHTAETAGLPTGRNILDYAEFTDDITHERIGYYIGEINGEDGILKIIDFN